MAEHVLNIGWLSQSPGASTREIGREPGYDPPATRQLASDGAAGLRRSEGKDMDDTARKRTVL